jgi:riboflavin synthase
MPHDERFMFTGIIEDKGKVIRVEHGRQGRKLTLQVPIHLTEVQLGDSININGVCLTIVDKRNETITLDLSSETLQKTALEELKEGDQVNLERPLRLTDRLGGHIVTGHVDGIGVITEKRQEGDFLHLKVRIQKPISRHIVQKGSIAIDGISLTVNECEGEEVKITLIPYTLKRTTLMEKRVGDHVNVETDIVGKYVEKMMDRKDEKSKGVDLSFLKEHGFVESE